MYPYYFMNPQYSSSMNPSVNPNMNPNSLNPPLPSQYGGMPMSLHNPYMAYSGNPSMSVPPYGQSKNPQRNLPTSGLPYGMSSYSSPGTGSMYPPQYMGQYQSNMMGNYGQNAPPSFSHVMGLDKTELGSKNPEISGFIPNN